jgi:hypothetical protein
MQTTCRDCGRTLDPKARGCPTCAWNVEAEAMHELLKPDGLLVCEDADLTSADSEPSTKLKEFSRLFAGLGPKWGVDYQG